MVAESQQKLETRSPCAPDEAGAGRRCGGDGEEKPVDGADPGQKGCLMCGACGAAGRCILD